LNNHSRIIINIIIKALLAATITILKQKGDWSHYYINQDGSSAHQMSSNDNAANLSYRTSENEDNINN
jgi:hypothetical protein